MKVNPNELPVMLRQYLFESDYGIKTEDDEFTEEELLDYAEHVKELDKTGEWWGFACYGGDKKNLRAELTRFISKCKKNRGACERKAEVSNSKVVVETKSRPPLDTKEQRMAYFKELYCQLNEEGQKMLYMYVMGLKREQEKERAAIIASYEKLNEGGRKKVEEYIDDLIKTGMYEQHSKEKENNR